MNRNCIRLGLCCIITAVVTGATDKPASKESKKIDFSEQISDLRLLQYKRLDLEALIKSKKCQFDIIGRVFTSNGTPVESQLLDCESLPNLGSLLRQLGIDLGRLGGTQLRVFKMNSIVQTSRFLRTKSEKEAHAIADIIIEPGDSILFTTLE